MRQIPLRLILIVPFALQIFGAVGITGWLSLKNGEKAVNDLTRELRSQVSARISQKLKDNLNTAPLLAKLNVEAIASNAIDPNNPQQLEDYLIRQLKQFDNVTTITIATEQPNYVGIGYERGNLLYLSLWNSADKGTLEWLIDAQKKRHLVVQDRNYDHRRRPWYQDTIKAGKLIWNDIYLTVTPQNLVISASQPFYNDKGKVLGVVSIDLTLQQIDRFLQSLQIGKTGQAFIIDRDGKLIATSVKQKPALTNSKSQAPQRILAVDSSDPVVSNAVRHLQSNFSQGTQQTDFQLNGEHILVQVTPFSDLDGIDWQIVTAIPESDFMETIQANTRQTLGLCSIALCIATLTGILTSGWIVRFLSKTIAAADALSQGDWDRRVPEGRSTELALLGQAFNRMAEQMQESFSKLEYTAYHDILTALPNREAILDKLSQAIANSSADPPSLFAIFFLDLDFFKFVNDSFGHLAGDRLLVAVAERLQQVIRSTDTLARFGGDEFIILLEPIADISQVTCLADQILKSFQSPFDLDGNQLFISTSIGIVLSTMAKGNPENFLRNADLALYRAKANGKNSYEVFNQLMHDRAIERLQLETDLRNAIERQEFELYYQPIVSASSLKIIGFETLIRWHHPVLGLVSPAKFIPLLEETGLIIPLGWWILRQACSQMQQWIEKYDNNPEIAIAVNITSQQFSHPNFLVQIEQILGETQLSPYNLKLEITESAFIQSEESIKAKLYGLRSLGIRLSLDDFGTGYSSLSYLHRFPIDTLKIDRSFIMNLQQHDKNLALVEAIVTLAHNLDMNVVAEGVETAEQLEILQRMGCEKIQGYLFSPPVPAIKAAAFLEGLRLTK